MVLEDVLNSLPSCHAVDASASYLPVTYKSFGLTVALTDTGGVVSKTVWDNSEIKIKAKGVTSYECGLLPFCSRSYRSRN